MATKIEMAVRKYQEFRIAAQNTRNELLEAKKVVKAKEQIVQHLEQALDHANTLLDVAHNELLDTVMAESTLE